MHQHEWFGLLLERRSARLGCLSKAFMEMRSPRAITAERDSAFTPVEAASGSYRLMAASVCEPVISTPCFTSSVTGALTWRLSNSLNPERRQNMPSFMNNKAIVALLTGLLGP